MELPEDEGLPAGFTSDASLAFSLLIGGGIYDRSLDLVRAKVIVYSLRLEGIRE